MKTGNRLGKSGGWSKGRGDPGRDQIIPSPYNFVPLSPHVYFPDWDDRVSMDVPFSDGICGSFEVEVEAMTPIYVRCGGDNEKSSDFFRVTESGAYAIPGTSFKGMIRNVLEIASFGKIAPGVDDRRYGVRDLHNHKVYTDWMTNGSSPYKPTVRAGWLKLNDNKEWILYPCEFARIEQEELERFHGSGLELGQQQSGPEKYEKWKKNLKINCDIGEEKEYPHTNVKLRYRKATTPGKGEKEGILVFTGQPSKRKQSGCTNRNGKSCSRGKHMEFIFFSESDNGCPVPPDVKRDFQFIHSDDKNNPNDEWKFWKAKLGKGERVPVFYLAYRGTPKRHTISEVAGEPGVKLHSIGLAMMYRLPYLHSIHQAIGNPADSPHFGVSRLDLAQAMFGMVDGANALRGRVSFGVLLEQTGNRVESEVTTVLGGPKASYYPNYLQQETGKDPGRVRKDYMTYMDAGARIRGWKRYPIRSDGYSPDPPASPSEKVEVRFKPLPAGTKFRGRIHVHNLREVELGALFWVLTWGGAKNLRHSLGMARPLGYGSVRVTVPEDSLDLSAVTGKKLQNPTDLSKVFESEMNNKCIPGVGGTETVWKETDQIRELLLMADSKSGVRPEMLSYPVLDPKNRRNEFSDFKKRDLYLLPYSRFPREQIKRPGPGSRAPVPRPVPDDLTPVQTVLREFKKLSGKKLRKRILELEDLSTHDCKQLTRAAKNRPDWNQREYLKDERDWITPLKEKCAEFDAGS